MRRRHRSGGGGHRHDTGWLCSTRTAYLRVLQEQDVDAGLELDSEPIAESPCHGCDQPAAGVPLALGALLDGIPEQAVLGIGLATGEGVSVALLVAIFVSNLPEGVGSAADMRAEGKSPAAVIRLWVGVAVVCALATVGGYALADLASGNVQAGIDGVAAGALLVMLVDSMVPEAREKTGNIAGLATMLGFAVAAALSNLT